MKAALVVRVEAMSALGRGCRHRPGWRRNNIAAGPALGAGRRAANMAVGGGLDNSHAIPHQILDRLLYRIFDQIIRACAAAGFLRIINGTPAR
jgi:hypothetical protein